MAYPVFHGRVVSGMGLGRKLGFPTFNLDARPDLGLGVYAVDVEIIGTDEVCHFALMHYGPKPTVGREDVFCEVYFLKFPEGLDVREMNIRVLGRLRDIVKFNSLEALVEQMKKDEVGAREKYFLL